MTTFTKAALCTAAAGAMAFTSAAPAEAQRYRDRDNDGISAGEVIAGALIIGGIAAIASASNRDRRGDRYRNNYYRSNGNPRAAINRCIRAAETDARRSGYRYANVVDVNRVRDTRRGWNISGRLEVQGQRGYRDQRRGYNNNRRGYNNRDRGRFSCQIRNGRIVDMDYNGIRGMRRY
ncbi:hypothetical protein [Alteriqipengyuania sp.]|uniref:hypothetical protein n=1 Tax=Alteriqipengyuania sp. TaxID=2800692 RepID=UPI0035197BB0